MLSAAIESTQVTEIGMMRAWLTSWDETVPAEGAMDHSMHGGMDGMMSAEEMTALENASGRAFDTAFMEMMIKHHETAIKAGPLPGQGRAPQAPHPVPDDHHTAIG